MTDGTTVSHAPIFDPVGGYPVVGAVAAVLLLLLLLGPARDRTTPRRRTMLVLFRLGVIALVILAMLRPSLLVPKIEKRPDTILIMVDRTRSMDVADLEGSKKRWEAAEQFVSLLNDVIAEVGEDLVFQVYGFDSDTHRLDEKDGKYEFNGPPTGEESNIGRSIDRTLRPEVGKRLGAAIVVSDGAQRTYAADALLPEVPVKQWLADRGFPLFTVPLGKERAAGQARDIEVRNLLTSEPVFVKNPLTAEATVVVQGFENQPVEVQFLVETSPGSGKMESVEAKRVRGSRESSELGEKLTFQYTPMLPGEYKVTVRAAVQPGELKSTNNETTTYVTVFAEGLNVLYVEGTPRVEQTFIRRSLDSSPDIHVDYVELNAQQEIAGRTDLLKRFAPGVYNVYLFGDIDAKAFTLEELTALSAAIRGGAGFAMLGGIHSFMSGGYGETVLKDVLPIKFGNLPKLDRQNFGEAVRSDLHLNEKVRVVPTIVGSNQSFLQLAARPSNQAAWEALPPLDGANLFPHGIAEGAVTLAETDTPGRPLPLVVSRDLERGRVLAIAFDSTWRWRMRGHEAAHKRFWRRTILWLAHKEDQAGENVWIRLPQRSFSPGSQLDFTVGAQTAEGAPIADAVFTSVVTLPDGSKLNASVRRRGDESFGELTLPPGPPGDYVVKVSATDAAKKPLGQAEARFYVFGQDLELDNSNAYPDLMRALAAMTPGGRAIEVKELPEVIRELQRRSLERRSETPELQSLWDRWEFLVLFVSLLSVEWFLRKKWGLV